MASQKALKDPNYVSSMIGESSTVSGETARVKVNASTGAVLTEASGGAALSTGTADGRKTVAAAGTAEALAGSTACKAVVITAELDNTGAVVVGGSTVVAALATRRGTPLNPGDSVTIPTTNLNLVYVDAIVTGDGVTYTYLT